MKTDMELYTDPGRDAGVKAALIALSDPVRDGMRWMNYACALEKQGIDVRIGRSIMEPRGATAAAEEFNELLHENRADWIFDVSGGNLSNLCLPYLDYTAYRKSRCIYAGFSDCTAVVNALAGTGKGALLYPVWLEDRPEALAEELKKWKKDPDTFTLDKPAARPLIPYERKKAAEEEKTAQFIGGNIRCFMKLAGTPWMPRGEGRILFLESSSCSLRVFESFLAQMQQMGLTESLPEIWLGRFNAIEESCGGRLPALERMMAAIRAIVSENLPVLCVDDIGHIVRSKGIWIGNPPFETERQHRF